MNWNQRITSYAAALSAIASLTLGAGAAQAQPADKDQAASTAAASGIETIVVTARRKAEQLQNVPVAVTALSQQDLLKTGNFQASDLARQVPNLNVDSAFAGNYNFAIRGQSQVFGGLFPSVVPYFADVPLFRVTEGQFYDLDNVQVLRGPQGTLFGRVTDGGNIMIVPQKPTNEFEGYVEAKAGDYNLYGVTGALNVPIIDEKLLFRASFDVDRRDGYVTNINNNADLGSVDYNSFRASLVFKPLPNLENYTILSYSDADETGTPLELHTVNSAAITNLFDGIVGPTLANEFAQGMQGALAAQNARGPFSAQVGNAAFGPDWGLYNKRHEIYAINTTTWTESDALTLKNIVGYTLFKDPYGIDYAGTSYRPFGGTVAPFTGNYLAILNPFVPDLNVVQRHVSEELQAQGTIGDLSYTAGTYLEWQRTPEPAEGYFTELFLIQAGLVQYTQTTSEALYGQVDYNLHKIIDGLSFEGGLRYTRDHADSQNAEYQSFDGLDLKALPLNGQCLTADASGGVPGFPNAIGDPFCEHLSTTSNALTYNVGLNYKVDDETLVYGKVSRGYRPGGFNSTAGGNGQFDFKPEYDVSVEAGLKSDYEIGPVKARTDLAIFHDDYTDIQKTVITVNAQNLSVLSITNAAAATIQGLELEQTFVPIEGLNVKLGWGYTDAHFKNDLTKTEFAADCPADPATEANFGFCPLNRLAETPQNTFTLGAHYTMPLGDSIGNVTFGGDLYHRSAMSISDTSYINPDSVLPTLTTLNLDAEWNNLLGHPFDLTFFMTNATDQKYVIAGQFLSQFSSVGVSSYEYAPPRMFGFTARYHFGEN
jgi:iron complex outermembrane recepter protein